MGIRSRLYLPEFKEEAVRLVHSFSGAACAIVARIGRLTTPKLAVTDCLPQGGSQSFMCRKEATHKSVTPLELRGRSE